MSWLHDIRYGIRVLLKALAANPVAGFVRFMYDVSAPLVAPFRGIVRDVTMGNGGLLEVWSVIAMVVYLLAAYLVARFVRIVTTPRPATAR